MQRNSVVTMDKQLIIKATRCTVILYERELFQLLATKPDLFETALSRGKGYNRAQTCENRKLKYESEEA